MEWYEILIYVAYILIILAAGISVLGGLVYTLQNIKDSIPAVAGVAFLIVVFLISWAIGSGDVSFKLKETLDAGTIKLIDGGLYTFYFLLFLAVLGVVVSNVQSIINRT